MIKAKDIRKGSRISYRNFGKSETGIIAEIDLEGEDGKLIHGRSTEGDE